MVKFSKKGLMYRLAYYGTGYDERRIEENLCPFLRQCLLGFVLCCVFVSIGVCVGAVTLSFFGTILLWTIFGWSDNFFLDQGTFIMSSCFMAALLIIILGSLFSGLHDRYKERKRWKRYQQNMLEMSDDYVEPKPSTTYRVIAEWYNSIHDKICPSIDFVE